MTRETSKTTHADVPCPDEQATGFLVVRKPPVWWAEFQRYMRAFDDGRFWTGWAEFCGELRTAIPVVQNDRYAGIDRTPLGRWDPLLDQLRGRDDIDERNLAAQRLIRCRLGPDPTVHWDVQFFDADLLPSLALADAAIMAADDPVEWEAIALTRCTDDHVPSTLGFDVGYWGGDHYSIIRDSVVGPEYHAPPPDEFASLRSRTECLNADVLFDTAADAREFRDWYRRQSWAEKESYGDEFQVIRVDARDVVP